MNISELSPQILWRHFAMLCECPRASGHEIALRDQLRGWADGLGLENLLDAGGNLIIRKPATRGMDGHVGVILQAHLDMVCQKNRGNEHDFSKDPIHPIIDGDWVRADGTTLGADNGIGVAAALAVLEDADIEHGPLEVLLTLDEEAGMTGARTLEPELLRGKFLFNLDTEDMGELCVGCAGGLDLTLRRHVGHDPLSAAFMTRQICVTGLKGGHSGCDIHLERPNAIRLLARFLQEARQQTDLRLISMNGGSVRNALPREACAIVAVPACDGGILEALAEVAEDRFRLEFTGVDEGICVSVDESGTCPSGSGAGEMLRAADTQSVIDLLLALPHGVRRWSNVLLDVVETSNNLGVVELERDFEVVLMARSLTEAGLNDVASCIAACARLGHATVERGTAYPGWVPDMSSRALQVAQGVYRAQFLAEPRVTVMHAGLECGLIGAKYPRVEMVSFGPTIENAHSPDERVEIKAVAEFWEFLKACLVTVPRVW